jgi:methyl-accepting chemotaxis protein WspA
MNFRDLGIRHRFFLITGIVVIGFVLLLVLSGAILDRVMINGDLYEDVVQKKDLIADILPPPMFVVDPFLLCHQIAAEKDSARRAELIERLEADAADFEGRFQYWSANLPEGKLRTLLLERAAPPGREFLRIAETEYVPLVKGAAVAGKTAEGVLHEDLTKAFRAHRMAVLEAVKQSRAEVAQTEAEAAEAVSAGNTTAVLLSVLIVAAILVAGYFILGSVRRSIEQLRDNMRRMAESEADLTARIETDAGGEVGELAHWFNLFVEKIAALVTTVRRSSVQLTSSSTEMAATSKEQESTVNSFGASTNQIAASVQEISATGLELVKTVGEVIQIAHHSATLAGTGRSNLEMMESTMSQLQDSSASISSKLSVISDKAGEITSVVTTITKVADQTNLLSVNAAIEAEKAGEYGRGFLVVAQEIRRLADQTAAATLDIEQTVQEMQSSVSAGVMEMDKFADHVRRSVDVVGEVGTQLGEIITEVERLTTRFDSVAEGMRSQTQGAEQINDAMRSLNDTVQRAVSSLREVTSVAEELRGAANLMNEEIARFKLGD